MDFFYATILWESIDVAGEKENPTGWSVWGLHRDGNIDRFLKPMSLYGLFCLTRLWSLYGTYANAIYGRNSKLGWAKPANKYQHDNKIPWKVAAILKIEDKPVIVLWPAA